jgi:heme iron utilization protein
MVGTGSGGVNAGSLGSRLDSLGGMNDLAATVRQWLLSTTSATLCTLAAEAEVEGWPFGSLAPYALAADGTPLLLLSEIAQHTRNIGRDPRLSLFVRDPAATGDPQASWRVTVLGRARALEASEIEEAHARYSASVPEASSYFETHDFTYFALDPLRVRAIGGFGAIHWLPGSAILRDPLGGGLREASWRILSHMNGDHEEALRAIVAATTGTRPAKARMRVVERTGFLVETSGPEGLRYVGFGREIEAAEARDVFVQLTRDAQGRGHTVP